MRSVLRLWLVLISTLLLNLPMPAQTAASAHKTASAKTYCQPGGGFCFRYPSSWLLMGEVFAGNGVVVAPEQKEDRSLWDAITAGLMVPSPQSDADPVHIDRLIEQTMDSLREAGQNVETLQRQERTVDGMPAQMIKLRYHEKAGDRDWIEQIVFIQGPAGELYSVALKCAPPSLPRLEPALAEVLQSWKLTEPKPNSGYQGTTKSTVPSRKPPATSEPPKN